MITRAAIVGTAPSWEDTPWSDGTLHICSLNDAYKLPGFVRADRWYDFHPLDRFYTVPEPPPGHAPMVYAHQVPPGYYVRSEYHRDWLGAQTIPVFLNPGYREQWPAAVDWPHAQPFPKAEIEAYYGRYFTSSPAWMLAHLLMEGVKEIHIYGIHLSTEHEYIEQRPNFEFLIGRLLGSGKIRTTTQAGLRYYETQEGLVVLPDASPVLRSNFQYAFEPRPRAQLEPLKFDVFKAQAKRDRRMQALLQTPWYWPMATWDEPQPDGTTKKMRRLTSTLQQEILYFDELTADCQQQLGDMNVATMG